MRDPLDGTTRTTRGLVVFTIALLVSATSCYEPLYLEAWAPLTAPVDTACLKRELAAFTGREVKRSKRSSRLDESRHVVYRVDPDSIDIAQVIRRDSSVFLEASRESSQQTFTGERADSIFDAFVTLLLGARDSCGGTAPPSARELVVVSNSPPYQGWLLAGKKARLSVKRVSDTYRVLLDTIATRVDGQVAGSSWVQVERSELRRIPRGYAVVTDCSRRSLPATGGVVAVARASKDEVYTDILHAWRLDTNTLRFLPDSSGTLVCRARVRGAS
jgi:hypothetical protein